MAEMTAISVDGKDFPVYVNRPEGDIKGAIIVIHENFTYNHFFSGYARRSS